MHNWFVPQYTFGCIKDESEMNAGFDELVLEGTRKSSCVGLLFDLARGGHGESRGFWVCGIIISEMVLLNLWLKSKVSPD